MTSTDDPYVLRNSDIERLVNLAMDVADALGDNCPPNGQQIFNDALEANREIILEIVVSPRPAIRLSALDDQGECLILAEIEQQGH